MRVLFAVATLGKSYFSTEIRFSEVFDPKVLWRSAKTPKMSERVCENLENSYWLFCFDYFDVRSEKIFIFLLQFHSLFLSNRYSIMKRSVSKL